MLHIFPLDRVYSALEYLMKSDDSIHETAILLIWCVPSSDQADDQTRAGCSYLKQTCLDEFNLYKHIFLSGEAQL